MFDALRRGLEKHRSIRHELMLGLQARPMLIRSMLKNICVHWLDCRSLTPMTHTSATPVGYRAKSQRLI